MGVRSTCGVLGTYYGRKAWWQGLVWCSRLGFTLSPGCAGTHNIAEAGLKLLNIFVL